MGVLLDFTASDECTNVTVYDNNAGRNIFQSSLLN